MPDIIDTIISFLCQQGTQNQCSQFIASYPDVTQQLVWLVFFPTVFLLLFIFIIAGGVTNAIGGKYKTLVAVAIYIFIIFQGWYHYFLTLSRFWFVGIIILGGLFALTKKMGAASDGGGGGKKNLNPARGNWLKQSLLGSQVLDPRERLKNRKMAADELNLMRKQRKHLEDRVAKASEKERAEALKFIANLDSSILAVEDDMSNGLPPSVTYKDIEKRVHAH